MMTFKEFVENIHRAVSDAADLMGEKNRELVDRYFESVRLEDGTETLRPRTVTLSVPLVNEDGTSGEHTVSVPLISLIPVCGSQIERTTFSADLRLFMENGELQLSFPDEKAPKSHSTEGRLEIVIAPTQPAEGLQKLIDAYANAISEQL